ncbi:IclR family transcriptional regulator [Falsiroseomonas ponticola]|uniref:IclR family transcriptional regulator n=1 Tax=Falsiroseomonas ponticola TaxID=2786951 RepID=UPI00193387AF|nr:IclR family transcriptional regulator [Roseomonas ponticola]
MEEKDRQFVTALARGVQVLRCFTAARPELGTTEIAAMTGLAQSTVWRLCHTLTGMGVLVPGRDPGRLRPGYGLLSLGYAALAKGGIAEAAQPGMQRIADRFGVQLSLATRQDDTMLIVARAEAPTILRLSFTVGATLPIASTALGWAWLAGVDAAERLAVLARLEAGTRAEIEDALEHFARHGFVLNLRRAHPDVNSIGVPIICPDGSRVMALNCGGAVSVVTPELLAGPVAEAVKALAASLAPALAR